MAARMLPAAMTSLDARGAHVGGRRAVLRAILADLVADAPGTLGVVLATEGSTYAKAGTLLHVARDGTRHGWLSGGCLEPQVEAMASDVALGGRTRVFAIDTRDDDDLIAGSALGCRGRLQVLLAPLVGMDPFAVAFARLEAGNTGLRVSLSSDGALQAEAGDAAARTHLALDVDPCMAPMKWQVELAPTPAALVFGAGPESALLLPLLQGLGWNVDVVERRPRWLGAAAIADEHLRCVPQALPALPRPRYDAVLALNHNFELDLESLRAATGTDAPFVGVLGPPDRRDRLLRMLTADERAALASRLHAPVGLDLGGQGPEAIALAIAAQLQAACHGRGWRRA